MGFYFVFTMKPFILTLLILTNTHDCLQYKDKTLYQQLLDKYPDHHAEIASLYTELEEVGQEIAWMRSVVYPHTTILVIDMQNDFITGNLAVSGAGELLDPMFEMIEDDVWDQIIFSKDWHPADHISFLSNVGLRELDEDWLADHPGEIEMGQEVVFKRDPPYHQVMWPNHCVQGSEGSELENRMPIPANFEFLEKGTNPEIDSYSAFYDNTGVVGAGSTGLDAMVVNTTEIVVVGLALDFCVGLTSLDSLKLAFPTTLLRDMTKPVHQESGAEMLLQVELAGGRVTTFQEWQQEFGSWKKAKQLAEHFITFYKRQTSGSNSKNIWFGQIWVSVIMIDFVWNNLI